MQLPGCHGPFQCVFPPGYTNREGEPLPLIIQKSDGGYGYAASDLAALWDRFGRLHADTALGVLRHAGAGYPDAQAAAREHGLGLTAWGLMAHG